MFREMRRKKQALDRTEIDRILYYGTNGVLALSGDEEYPYAVPISYVQDGDVLYFHCARSGHKLDLIRQNPKASFCVVDQDQIHPEAYTTWFRSVIVFGTVHILEDGQEKRQAIEKLALKYAPADSVENREEFIRKDWIPLCMLKMTIDHVTGKEGIELVRQKEETGKAA